MSRGWDFSSGDWWIRCDVCNRKVKASETKERWDGYRVCADDYEVRHSMDFIRARNDKIGVPFSRGNPEDTFVGEYTPTEHTWNGEAVDLMEMN